MPNSELTFIQWVEIKGELSFGNSQIYATGFKKNYNIEKIPFSVVGYILQNVIFITSPGSGVINKNTAIDFLSTSCMFSTLNSLPMIVLAFRTTTQYIDIVSKTS